MAKSKQHRRRLYKVENTPVKETPRYDGDGTEWIFESPDGGKTIYKRAMGSDEKILVNGSRQLELFPDLYPPKKETNSDEEWLVNQYNRNRDVEDHITGSGEIKKDGLYPWHNNEDDDEEKQEWPGLDAINKEWV